MGRSGYMPDKQADQVIWSNRFVEVVQSDAAQYGVPTAMMTAVAALNNTVQETWVTASNPATHTRGSISNKNNALKAMKAYVRGIVSIIQGTPNVTDEMKIAAGVTVRKTRPTPKPSPAQRPFVKVMNVDGRTVTFELRQDAAKRGRPAGTASVTILWASGVSSPMTADGWTFAMTTTKISVDVPVPPSATGDTVWVMAYWSNTRGEMGPGSTPISINLPAGGQMQTKAQPVMTMRAA